jgi:hypothetical protein
VDRHAREIDPAFGGAQGSRRPDSGHTSTLNCYPAGSSLFASSPAAQTQAGERKATGPLKSSGNPPALPGRLPKFDNSGSRF